MVAIKNFVMPSSCYDCPFAKNERTNDYGSFCECGILEDYETINLLEHSKYPNCPLVEIEERKVGKWLDVHSTEYAEFSVTDMKCNRCKRWASLVLPHKTTCTYDFCPNCNAEMRGSENE